VPQRRIDQFQATFEPQCSLRQGLHHIQQSLAVPFRFCLVGPTRTFFRELTKFFGR
jgi:hypothetical protein